MNIKGDLKTVIRNYLLLTQPINKLEKREIKVLSLLMYYYFLEKPNFKREEDLWKKVFDYDTKMDIKIELDIPDSNFQNVLSNLRRKKALIGRKIHEHFLPNIDTSTNSFKISYNFQINDTPNS